MADVVGFASSSQSKAPRLRQEASQIDFELGGLAVEADRQQAAVDRCIEALREKAELLVSQLARAPKDDNSSSSALERRRSELEEEIRAIEHRRNIARSSSIIGTNGGISDYGWSPAQIARRNALKERIAFAEARQSRSSDLAQEQVRHCQLQLAELRDARSALALRSSAARSTILTGQASTPWLGRYEALLEKQARIADHMAASLVDEKVLRLDQMVLAATNALRDAAAGSGNAPPEHLVGALRCVRGLAETERRRCGLLTEQWQELQGEQTQSDNGFTLAPPPVGPRRTFSPSRVGDWDLDPGAAPREPVTSDRWGFSDGRLRSNDF